MKPFVPTREEAKRLYQASYPYLHSHLRWIADGRILAKSLKTSSGLPAPLMQELIEALPHRFIGFDLSITWVTGGVRVHYGDTFAAGEAKTLVGALTELWISIHALGHEVQI